MPNAALRLRTLAEQLLGAALPVRLRAWDGSEAGPSDGPVLVVRHRRALRRLMWRPGELGLVRAWVAGDIDVEGDLYTVLDRLTGVVWERDSASTAAAAPGAGAVASAAAGAKRLRGALGALRDPAVRSALQELAVLAGPLPPPPPPREEMRRPRRGPLHTKSSDKKAISHHYDVGNDFYELVLGPSMVYSCAYWAPDDAVPASDTAQASDTAHALRDPLTGNTAEAAEVAEAPSASASASGAVTGTGPTGPTGTNGTDGTVFGVGGTLEDAQRDKLDLVCRKLALQPGMRLLDVGCGWGSMALHAARTYDVHVTGITLSGEQATYARKRVADEGLTDQVEIRVQDYRDVADGPYDAISSIGMAEHVGSARYLEYAQDLYALLRPGGRLLNHQIARRPLADEAEYRIDQFIGAYVFPDGELSPVGTTVGLLERAGFEVRDLESIREHYALTLRRWVANLEAGWARAVRLTGPGRARVWRLYMAASALSFERNRIGVNQVLAVKTPGSGAAGLPLRTRAWAT